MTASVPAKAESLLPLKQVEPATPASLLQDGCTDSILSQVVDRNGEITPREANNLIVPRLVKDTIKTLINLIFEVQVYLAILSSFFSSETSDHSLDYITAHLNFIFHCRNKW